MRTRETDRSETDRWKGVRTHPVLLLMMILLVMAVFRIASGMHLFAFRH